LREVFTRLGAGGRREPSYSIEAVETVNMETDVSDMINLTDSLDEINMLAHYLGDMEPHELDSLSAILQTGVLEKECGAAALINLLDADNFDAFRLIDADNAVELGLYWAKEMPEIIPEGMGLREYGESLILGENGMFTRWGYVYQRMELSGQYDGVVPARYRIVDAATPKRERAVILQNAMDETFAPVTLLEKPAMFTNSRIDRATVPAGLC